MAWWNGLTEPQRAAALAAAGTAVPAEAWDSAKVSGLRAAGFEPKTIWYRPTDYVRGIADATAAGAASIPPAGVDPVSWMLGYHEAQGRGAQAPQPAPEVPAARVAATPVKPIKQRLGLQLTIDPEHLPDAEQVELAVQAACQIQSLMKVLNREADNGDGGFIRAVAVRAEELGRAIAFGLELDKLEDLVDMHEQVLGTRPDVIATEGTAS